MLRKKLLSMSIMSNYTWLERLQFLHHPNDSTLWAWPLSWRPAAGLGGYLGWLSREIPELSREVLGSVDKVSADLKLFFRDEAKTPEGICLWNHSFLSDSGIMTIIIIISQSCVSSPHKISLMHCNNLRETEFLRKLSPGIHISPSLPTQ